MWHWGADLAEHRGWSEPGMLGKKPIRLHRKSLLFKEIVPELIYLQETWNVFLDWQSVGFVWLI